MLESLLKSIGVSDEVRVHFEQATLEWQRQLWLWIGLALIVPIGWYIYQRQRQNLASVPPSLRIALTVTRVAILVLLVLVLAAPYLKLDLTLEKLPIVALLFDQSQSMGLPAGPFESDADLLKAAEATGYPVTDGKVDPALRKTLNDKTRARFVQEAVGHRAAEWLKPLADKYELRLYALDGGIKRLAVDDPTTVPELSTQGAKTHLGDGVARVIDEAAGRPIAGVVVFSDGQNTGGISPGEAARIADEAETHIFAVPAGSDAPLRDVSIVDVFAPDLVSKGDTVHVSVTLQVQGYPEQPVKVQLFEDGKPSPIDSKDLVLRNTEQQHVDLTFEAKEKGTKTLSVKLSPNIELPEDLKENNTDEVVVRVSDEKLKVLYVEGLPRWDFRFLKNAMRRDHGLGGRGLVGAVTSAMAGAASAPALSSDGKTTAEPDIVLEAEVRRRPPADRQVLPATVEALAEYHTIILGDVSPTLLDSGFRNLLAEAVREKGVGLIVEAGPEAMPHAFDAQFQDLLPVKLRRRTAGLEAQAYKPFHVEVSPDGSLHEAMRLYDEAGRNGNVWAQMPAFFWCAAVARAAPAATVLAYNSSVENRYGKLPLIAHHYAGEGKVLFIGTDSTWLWRQNVGDRFFYKFWGQAIRFVARRDETAKKKSWVEVHPVRTSPGEPVEIELLAYRADGAPRTESKLSMRLERQGAPTEMLELLADRATVGRYTARYVPSENGGYRMVYDPGEGQESVDAHLHVRPSAEEMRRPNVDITALAQLGKVVKLNDLTTIGSQLAGKPRTTKLYREVPIWDNWLVLSVLVFIYSVDVGLRRLAGLS
ncbi:MAG TPA: hypothetical protein VJ783_18220 [Pirellulales bacterium]|nr:hypothetical protein [Pirellulales bacterium]